MGVHGRGIGRGEGTRYVQEELRREETPEERVRELAAREEVDKKSLAARAKWESLFRLK